jgi:hypothetical protein
VPRVRLTAPADEERLGGRLRVVHEPLRHFRKVRAARRLRDELEQLRAGPADVLPRLLR